MSTQSSNSRETYHRLRIGDRVQVMQTSSAGNPRTPTYVRGKTGIVTKLHGTMLNPRDHRGIYPPLCSVLFSVHEVFGGASRGTLLVDLHEEWLVNAEVQNGNPRLPG